MQCPTCRRVSRTSGVRKLLRGNYNPTTKRKRHPNLQWVTLSSGERVKVCARCKKKAAQDPNYFTKKGLEKKSA